MWRDQCKIYRLVIFFFLPLSLFSAFISLPGREELSYSPTYSVLNLVVGVRRLWNSVVASEPAPLGTGVLWLVRQHLVKSNGVLWLVSQHL